MPLLHPVIDSDPKFFIDPITRAITTTDKDKIILVKGDRNSESYTFAVPRMIEDHDMKECNKVRVHFINTDAVTMQTSPGIFELDGSLEEYEHDGKDYVIFTWLVDSSATAYAGKLAFAVEYACFDDVNKVYSWNTLPYSNITVSDGINNTTVVETQYKDILQDWYNKIYGSSELPIKFVTQAEYTALGNNYETNVLYMITDDQTLASFKTEVENSIEEFETEIEKFKNDVTVLTTGFDGEIKALNDAQVSVKDIATGETIEFNQHEALPTARGENFETRLRTLEGAGYLTAVPDEYVTEDELNAKGYLTEVPAEYVTEDKLNEKGYLTADDISSGILEIDPNVPAWAKEENKPTYTAAEVGAVPLWSTGSGNEQMAEKAYRACNADDAKRAQTADKAKMIDGCNSWYSVDGHPYVDIPFSPTGANLTGLYVVQAKLSGTTTPSIILFVPVGNFTYKTPEINDIKYDDDIYYHCYVRTEIDVEGGKYRIGVRHNGHNTADDWIPDFVFGTIKVWQILSLS